MKSGEDALAVSKSILKWFLVVAGEKGVWSPGAMGHRQEYA